MDFLVVVEHLLILVLVVDLLLIIILLLLRAVGPSCSHYSRPCYESGHYRECRRNRLAVTAKGKEIESSHGESIVGPFARCGWHRGRRRGSLDQ